MVGRALLNNYGFYEWFPCVGRFGNLGLGWVSGFRYMYMEV